MRRVVFFALPLSHTWRDSPVRVFAPDTRRVRVADAPAARRVVARRLAAVLTGACPSYR